MNNLPDAPWIREAELYGVGNDTEDLYCPVCGYENPESLAIYDGDVIGCDHCIKFVDPWEWVEDHKEVYE